jgi:hypothetical protein
MEKEDNKTLIEISLKIDDFLLELAKEYKISALEISGIVNARLYTLHYSIDTKDQYFDMLRHVLKMSSEELNPITVH